MFPKKRPSWNMILKVDVCVIKLTYMNWIKEKINLYLFLRTDIKLADFLLQLLRCFLSRNKTNKSTYLAKLHKCLYSNNMWFWKNWHTSLAMWQKKQYMHDQCDVVIILDLSFELLSSSAEWVWLSCCFWWWYEWDASLLRLTVSSQLFRNILSVV